jgi:hypothetical protein
MSGLKSFTYRQECIAYELMYRRWFEVRSRGPRSLRRGQQNQPGAADHAVAVIIKRVAGLAGLQTPELGAFAALGFKDPSIMAVAALLQYLSPLGWEHISLTGDYLMAQKLEAWRRSLQATPPSRSDPLVYDCSIF